LYAFCSEKKLSFSIHIENDIADFVKDCINRMLPEGGSIFDPTCGKYNRQFKKYFSGEYQYDKNYQYKGTDQLYGFDVFKSSSPTPDYDLVWYDPPFTPAPKFDKRADNYGTEKIGGIDSIKEYFSVPVIKNLMSFSKKFLAVRGMDFYYPINSFNFYSFYDMLIKNVLEKTEFNLYCLYIMKYTRQDWDRIIQINKRPVINYSYTAIFTKDGF